MLQKIGNIKAVSSHSLLFTTLLFLLATALFLWADARQATAGDAQTVYLPIIRNGLGPCPAALHDPTKWHSLVNPVMGCHYNHEHKHDPNDVADIFGPAGAWFGGTSLSYPWQTTNENLTKHETYAWIVRRNIPANGRSIWIKDFRWQIHADSAPFTAPDGSIHGGYLGRFHSYSLEAQTCNSAGQCGIIRTGGWIDFGVLEISNIDPCVYLPTDPGQQEACGHLGRRRIHFYNPTGNVPNKSSFFWYGRAGLINGPLPVLHSFQVAVASGDNSVNVVPDDLYSLNFFCPEWDCPLNGSTIQAHVLAFSVNSNYDSDGDGLVSFSGYTDRYGVLAPECTTPSLDCVPIILENAPVGAVQHRDDVDLGLNTTGEKDFDISPQGSWWITYPPTPTFDSSYSWPEIMQSYLCYIPDADAPPLDSSLADD